MTPKPAAEGPEGVLIVDKQPGWTSHQVVGRARRLLDTRKVGHAGTLDPMATGVLVLGVGRATRLLGYLMRTTKSYRATVRFGIGTDTDDAEGSVIGAVGAAGLTRDRVAAAVPAYRGAIMQVPTQVSAIKIDGVRSYARARAGEQVELAARPVRIDEFTLDSFRTATVAGVEVCDVEISVTCSSGTYIRALARDLGRDLGTAGHLTALSRTRVGDFGLAEAVRIEAEDAATPDLIDLATAARRSLPWVQVDESQSRAVHYGRPLPDLTLTDEVTALLDPDGALLALYRPAEIGAKPISVFVDGSMAHG